MPRVERIDHVALTVSDLERSISWYERHLGLERRYADVWDGPPIMMGAGETCVALFPSRDGSDAPATIRMLHLAFRVDRAGFDASRAHLHAAGISFRDVEHENCWSLYFADPDGHQLELTTYDAP